MRNMARVGHISGLLVFFVGIGLLIFTFVLAYLAFTNPDRIKTFTDLIPVSGGGYKDALKALGYVVAIGLLWMMGSLAGRIVGHGIGMFKARPSAEGDKES